MKKLIRIVVPALLTLLIVASVLWYLFVYDRTFTRDFLLSQARFQDEYGNTKISAWFYDAAYRFSGKEENVAIELAYQYESIGNFTKAEYTLTQAINADPTADLYTALCRTYVLQDKLLDAVNMLDNIKDPVIKAKMDALRPHAPSVDYPGGFYSQYMDIHFSSQAKSIYYTVDGNYPSVAGSTYANSITLPTGETTIHAIAVDGNGLVSPLTVLSYTITGIIEEVAFADPAMEIAMRQLIGVDSGKTVLTNQLWEITEFTVPAEAVSYDDLALMPYLKKLTIHGKFLDSFESLSTLGNLQTLDLTGCRFPSDSLSVLAALPSLTHLTLADCNLSTIAELANAQYLTHLDLSNNTIRNLEVLTPMTTLQEINLEHNAVTNLSALTSLGSLQTIKVSYNSLTTLEPLGGCQQLTHIEADHNQLTSLKGMDILSKLSHLSVDYNALTSIDRLKECKTLLNLSIASNEISDLSPLNGLTQLEVLDFSSNKVEALPAWAEDSKIKTLDGSFNQLTSLDSLAKYRELSHIYMDYNLVTNVDALENCYCLVQLNVYGNAIADVEKLRERDIIVNYDPTFKAED